MMADSTQARYTDQGGNEQCASLSSFVCLFVFWFIASEGNVSKSPGGTGE